MKAVADLIASARGGGLTAEIALRDYVRLMLASWGPGRAKITEFLRTASPRDWLTLDGSMRAQWYGGWGDRPARAGGLRRAWSAVRSLCGARSDVLALGIASMDRDGRVRETAVRKIATKADPLAGPILTLRTIDWVDEIAKSALSVLGERLPNERSLLIASAPLAFALSDRQRSSGIDQVVLDRAGTDPEVRAALLEADVLTRRRVIAHEPVRAACTLEELVTLAVTDPDTVVASAAGVTAVQRIGRSTHANEVLERLLAGPALVRRDVLVALPDDEHLREIAERHLFDRSAVVRRVAQHAFARSGGDVARSYRAALARSEHAPIALVELAHVGSSEDRQVVLRALKSADSAVRRAAVLAARWIAGELLVDLLVPLLWDPSPGVTRAAERSLRRVILERSVLVDLAVAPGGHSRRAAYRLMRRRTALERVEADLIGLADRDATNQRDAFGDLRSWLQRGAASVPHGDLTTRRRLSQLLDAVAGQLRSNDVDLVRFHAGLRSTDLGE